MAPFEPQLRWQDRLGCVVLIAAVVLGVTFTVFDLPPATAMVTFQRRYLDSVGFLNTALLTAGLLAVILIPVWLLVQRMFLAQRRRD